MVRPPPHPLAHAGCNDGGAATALPPLAYSLPLWVQTSTPADDGAGGGVGAAANPHAAALVAALARADAWVARGAVIGATPLPALAARIAAAPGMAATLPPLTAVVPSVGDVMHLAAQMDAAVTAAMPRARAQSAPLSLPLLQTGTASAGTDGGGDGAPGALAAADGAAFELVCRVLLATDPSALLAFVDAVEAHTPMALRSVVPRSLRSNLQLQTQLPGMSRAALTALTAAVAKLDARSSAAASPAGGGGRRGGGSGGSSATAWYMRAVCALPMAVPHPLAPASPPDAAPSPALATRVALLRRASYDTAAARLLLAHGCWQGALQVLRDVEAADDFDVDSSAHALASTVFDVAPGGVVVAPGGVPAAPHVGAGDAGARCTAVAHVLGDLTSFGVLHTNAILQQRLAPVAASTAPRASVSHHGSGSSSGGGGGGSVARIVSTSPAPHGASASAAVARAAKGVRAAETLMTATAFSGAVRWSAASTRRTVVFHVLFKHALETGDTARLIALWRRIPAPYTLPSVLTTLRQVLESAPPAGALQPAALLPVGAVAPALAVLRNEHLARLEALVRYWRKAGARGVTEGTVLRGWGTAS